MKEINQDEYRVTYDPATATVVCAGSFRLRGEEYAPILAMLLEAANAEHDTLTVDVSALAFLNSSGINTLSKFVLRMRQYKRSRLVVKGSERYPWQKKSLSNLQRLLPDLQLKLT
jgi:hypothetical protein